MEMQLIPQVLPSDIIIYDILTRVPPMSLVRFKCVCKYWSNLFTHDTLFATLHSQNYNKSTSSGGFVGVTSKDHALIFIDHNDKKKTILPFPGNDPVHHIQHSFNGFLLLFCCSKDEETFSYYVYNPITCYAFHIPIPIDDLAPGKEDSCHFGLCYNPIIRKHKVVFCGPFKTSPAPKVKFLILGEELGGNIVPWRDIVVPSTFKLSNDKYVGACACFCLNDSLYWIVLRDSSKPYLLGLNISREFFYRIKLPVPRISVCCFEMGGVLSSSYYDCQTNGLKIWTLKKETDGYEEDDHEWVLKFNIDLNGSMETLHASALHHITHYGLDLFAVLTDPTLKFIFASVNINTKGNIYRWSYYSYDMELKQLETIHGLMKTQIRWHVPSFGYC